MKRCQTCKRELPMSDFNKKRTNPDGLQKTCRACQAIGRKSYYDRNKAKEFANHSAYVERHKDKVYAKIAQTRASNPEFYKKVHARLAVRKTKDLGFLVFTSYRKRTVRAFQIQSTSRAYTDRELVGCSDETFIAHLESTFTDGMSWDSYRQKLTQIDHIIMCSDFDLSLPSHQLVCFNFTNTRMLWTADNVGKTKNERYSPEAIAKIVSERLAQ